MREAISDTSPIQYLHQIGCLHLLAEFYDRTIIPSSVAHELQRGRAIGVDLPDLSALPWVKVQSVQGVGTVPVAFNLGAGEKEVLALGIELPGTLLILDEKLGRLYAETLKLTFTGTLGILLRARSEGRITRVEPLLQRLNRLGFRLSSRTYAAVLKQAGE